MEVDLGDLAGGDSDSVTAASIVGYGSTSGPGAASTLQLAPPNMPNAWGYSTRLVDSSGHGITAVYLKTACPAVVNGGGGGGGSSPGGLGIGSSSNHVQAPASAQDTLQQCGAKVASVFHEVITYQPGGRYWDLQWIELALYLAAALALAGLCVWWVRQRLP